MNYLRVAERPDSRPHPKTVLCAELEKPPHVPVPGEIEHARVWLMSVPQKITGNRVDPASLHLKQNILPVLGANPNRMNLAHGQYQWPAIVLQTLTGHAENLTSRVGSTPLQVIAQHGRLACAPHARTHRRDACVTLALRRRPLKSRPSPLSSMPHVPGSGTASGEADGAADAAGIALPSPASTP